jgi:hypothetical protein
MHEAITLLPCLPRGVPLTKMEHREYSTAQFH